MITIKEEYLKRLGTVPDRVLAAEAGVSLQAIFTARQNRKIEPHYKHNDTPLKKLSRDNYQMLIGELGKSRDTALARKYDISREYVRQLRVRNNVAKFSNFIQST